MPDAALACARGFELAGVGLDGSQQVIHVFVRRIGAHLNARRIGIDQTDGCVRSASQLGQALPVHHADFDRGETDGVTVSGCRSNGRMPHDTATACAVDHCDGLAEVFFEQAGHDAGHRIGAATCAPRHDHGDGADGIILSGSRQGSCQKSQTSNSAGNQSTA